MNNEFMDAVLKIKELCAQQTECSDACPYDNICICTIMNEWQDKPSNWSIP
jgi:hypothetical protein